MSELPEVVSSRVAYEGRIIKLRVDEITLPQGGTTTREVVEHPGAVVIAAVDEGQEVYLVRQYRHAVRQELLELPAGCLEAGEAPLEAAKRELREETGVTAKDWTALGTFFSSPGFANEQMHIFLATGLSHGETDPDFDEDIAIVKYPLADLLAHLGNVTDAKTLATLLLVGQRCGQAGGRAARETDS